MDPLLVTAARTGDVEFLKKARSLKEMEYLLTQTPSENGGPLGGNIFHLSTSFGRVEFFREATKLLPEDVIQRLVFEPDKLCGYTPLHAAAFKGKVNYMIVKLIKEIYKRSRVGKPWMALNQHDMTPLHIALEKHKDNEACALEILSMDVHFESAFVVDENSNTPLYFALKNGFDQVAEKILTYFMFSAAAFCTKDKDVPTPFHLAPYSSENVLRLLFKNFANDIDKTDNRGYNALHQWAEKGDALPCKVLLENDNFGELRTKVFKQLVCATEHKSIETPLNIAARKKQSELAEILIRGYQQVSVVNLTGNINQVSQPATTASVECPPWKMKSKYGNTPLHSAVYTKPANVKLALKLLSLDPKLCRIRNNMGESPFFLAVRSGCAQVVDEILKIEEPRFELLRSNKGTTVIHCLTFCPEDMGKTLLQKFWWMINLTDDNRKTALDKAKEANVQWLVNLLTNPFLIKKDRFDWVSACKREETQAVLAFIKHCHDLQGECRRENDTPLHHIKLLTYEDYQDLLNISSIRELRNTTDRDGATPLHRAIERKDILLAKILLLDYEVERFIVDHNGKTSMHLLAKLCKDNSDWEEMCKQINVNPYMKTSYIQSGTNLDQIRSTLSVVAALLATITFAAGFTLPGGINTSTGEALLATRASFLVFLLADVYAMCTAILVLFCLIWSMISEPNMARLLVDQSVFILMQSLYGTLLAFMTGIYTVIAKRSLWAAILIFVMCSIIGIFANRTILHYVFAKLFPSANISANTGSNTNLNKETLDQMRLLEEGSARGGVFSSESRELITSRDVE